MLFLESYVGKSGGDTPSWFAGGGSGGTEGAGGAGGKWESVSEEEDSPICVRTVARRVRLERFLATGGEGGSRVAGLVRVRKRVVGVGDSRTRLVLEDAVGSGAVSPTDVAAVRAGSKSCRMRLDEGAGEESEMPVPSRKSELAFRLAP